MTSEPSPLAPPEPPLADPAAGVVLRPWATTPDDAAVLAQAWADPSIAGTCGVPDDTSVEAAAAWIAGDHRRRASGRSLDLVVARAGGGSALGEVGLRNVQTRHRGELSWWVLESERGRGLATAAVGLLAAWALAPDGGGLEQVWARIAASNVASVRVATSAGLVRLGEAGGAEVWARGVGPPRRSGGGASSQVR